MGCGNSSFVLVMQEPPKKHDDVPTKEMFVINSLIGQGGFGKVLNAMFIKEKKWVAIKEIDKWEILQHKTGKSMIFAELASLKKTKHPFIIKLLFAFHDKKKLYFVLDLKTGKDLRYYLKKKIRFDERDICFILACMSSALVHIHSKNIIHRDIKPENIIFDDKGYPHLADFGVSHVQTDFTVDVSLTCRLASGTKQYLAPEIFTKSHVHGPESDFWSLGVVSYELLFGKRPFEKHCPHSFIKYLEQGHAASKKQKTKKDESTILYSKNNYITHSSSPVKTTALSMTTSLDYSSVDEFSPINSQFTNRNISSVIPKSAILSPLSFKNPIKFPSILSNMDDMIPITENVVNTTNFSSSIYKPELSDLNMSPPLIVPKQHESNKEEEIEFEDASNLAFALEYDATGTFDHWIVDQGDLAPNLMVVIPEMPIGRPCLSTACIRILEGLFEVRPSHRLGCRNFNVLRNHKWFNSWGYSDWQMLEDKIFVSPFIPSKRVLNKKLQNSNKVIGYDSNESDCSDESEDDSEEDKKQKFDNPLLTIDQELQFSDFNYISEEYQPLFDLNISKNNIRSQTLSSSSSCKIESSQSSQSIVNNNNSNSSKSIINNFDPLQHNSIPIKSSSNSSITLPTRKSSLALTFFGGKPEAVMITKNDNNKYNMIGGINLGKSCGIVDKIHNSSSMGSSIGNKVRKITIRGKSRIGISSRNKIPQNSSYILPNIFN